MQRLREEQKQLNLSDSLTLEDLKKMTYLEQVIKEVMRVIPAVGGGFREVIETFEFGGYSIPKGWTIQYQIAQTHKDSDIYAECDRFDPDRFLMQQRVGETPKTALHRFSPERAEDKQQSFGYIPFGGGLREYLGKEFARLEMRIFASMLLRQYEWELLPHQDLELVTVPTPHPRDGLKINFRKKA